MFQVNLTFRIIFAEGRYICKFRRAKLYAPPGENDYARFLEDIGDEHAG